MELRPIARVHTDFGSKFGVPRQSGLVPELAAVLEFEPGFRSPEAVRGLEAFSHIWLLWYFSESARAGNASPPRCGRLGWEATCAWACSPAALRSVRTASVCPAWSWNGSISVIPTDPC